MKMILCGLVPGNRGAAAALALVGVLALEGAAAAQVVVGVGAPALRVQVAPPPGRVELVPSAPSPQHTWVRGYHSWNGSGYEWVPGRYEIPPQPGHVWIPARWTPRGRHWVHTPGYWTVGAPRYQQPVYAQPPQPVYAQPQPAYAQPPQPVYAQPPAYVPPQPAYAQPPAYVPPQPVYGQPQPAYGQPGGEVMVQMAPPPPQAEVIPMAPSPGHVWIGGHWAWNGARYVWMPGRHELRRHGYVYEPARWNRWGRQWRYVPGHWRAQ